MNRCVSTNAEGITRDLLPPVRAAEGGTGPARILFLSTQVLGFKTHSRSFEVYAEAHPDVDAVHVRMVPPRSVRLLSRSVPLMSRSGWDFHRLRYSRLWAMKMREWFRKKLPLDRFDLVHVMTQHNGLALAEIPYPKRPAMVVQIDATTELECRDFGVGRVARRPVIGAERRVFESSSLVSCWSQWAADSVVEDYGIPAERVMVSLPAPLLSPPGRAGERVPGALPRIGFVGNAWKRKGGDRLMRWHQARWKDRAELHIYGNLPEAIANAKNVTCYGPMPHAELMDLHVPLLDMLVIPTHQDTLLLAAIEAASRGVPVITSRQAGVVETVRHGQTGYLCDPSSDEEFIQAIEALLDDEPKRRAMGRAAVEFVEERWNADRWHRPYMDRLVEIARRHRAGERSGVAPRTRGAARPAPSSHAG
jgi:glycosyltransferase involved in cell wall biosynthesis